MFGNNSIHNQGLIYTNHAVARINQRHITREAVEFTRKYGTEIENDGAHKVMIDYDACLAAEGDGVNLYPYYATTIVVSEDYVLKTAYLKESELLSS